ncbi:MAG: endopeptidase La [bacterium]|nr:endopeptidase La [bacterium]
MNAGLTLPSSGKLKLPKRIGIFPLKETVVYPAVPAQLSSARPQTIQLVIEAFKKKQLLGLVTTQKETDAANVKNLYRVGTAAFVQQMWHLPDGSIRLIVQGICRIQIRRFFSSGPYPTAEARILLGQPTAKQAQPLVVGASGLFQQLISHLTHLPDELGIAALNIDQPDRLADFIAFHLNISIAEKQTLLEETDVAKRLKMLSGLMVQQLEVQELGSRVRSQVQTEMDQTRRDYLLREQIRVLQLELGEIEEQSVEIDTFRKRLNESALSTEARQEADRELDRLSRILVTSAEYSTCRTYLDWLLDLPWGKGTEDRLDIRKARQILNQDHHGLERAKERLLDFLAVRQLTVRPTSPILCLAGPPGVGKTSLGRSIARALGRQFVLIALGGMRDEAELRGHRRTYIGALPGRIIQGLQRAASNNPVLMLDEIDKLSPNSDLSSALLEVLDPQQNHAFRDHYLNVPFDLSEVLFIATANVVSAIPEALRDRLEILELPGYTEAEKVSIVRKHILPRQLAAHGLTRKHLTLKSPAIHKLISTYTQEAGLRNLEQKIGALCRRLARAVVEGHTGGVQIEPKNLETYLGPAPFFRESLDEVLEPGVAIGLAATSVGGEIVYIEAALMEGAQNLTLTGNLSEVMKESAQAALTYIRSHSQELDIAPNRFTHSDLHIHVPSGAVPKDGPSAGITIALALTSLFTGRPVQHRLASTGEITLRGRVLPVGGLKDKVLAAHRAGIKSLILPEANRSDLEEIPASVAKQLHFVFAKTIGDVFQKALGSQTKSS